MNRFARRKYRRQRSHNVTVINSDISEFNANPGSFDLAVCVHTLYVLEDPQATLARIYDWLKPGGVLYLIDVGRAIDIPRWAIYLFYHAVRQLGLRKAVRTFVENIQVMKQNKHIREAQQDGTYWLHSPSEIASVVRSCGFVIETQNTVYRGMSDLLVCRKSS
jgi:ubiquinone/menaquinone biosynthesis C-methylase UbiE